MSLQVQLNYAEHMAEKPSAYVYRPGEGEARPPTTQVVRRSVTMHDARSLGDALSLDGPGLAVVEQKSAVQNFYDADEVRAVYYPEVEALVKQATGAARVHVFDHNVRCAPMAKRGENGAQMPVKFAHNDYTERSGPQRVRDLLPDEAEDLIRGRFAVINVWRPIVGPVEKQPLAVCDAQSIAPEDLVATDLRYRDRTGEVYSLAFNPEHRWLYLPRMEQREVMLIKCFDSREDGRARFTCHTAFDDPTSAADAAERESIEVRTLAFWPAA